MKTVEKLSEVKVSVNGEEVETVKIQNPCQMWRDLQSWKVKYGNNVRVLVLREDGSAYKDFTVKVLKNGSTYMVNAIKETNRATVAKAKKAAVEALQKVEEEAKAQEEATAEQAAQDAAEAKKAKKRAYEKARREKLKAAKAAAKVETEE